MINKIIESKRQRIATRRGALRMPPATWFPAEDPMATEEPTRPSDVPADYEWRPYCKTTPFSSGGASNMWRDTTEAGWCMPGISFDELRKAKT